MPDEDQEHNEVEVVTIRRNSSAAHQEPDHHACHHDHRHPHSDNSPSSNQISSLDRETLIEGLKGLSKEAVWRVKGFVQFGGDKDVHILNWAFGRYTLCLSNKEETSLVPSADTGSAAFTVMGARGEMEYYTRRFAEAIGGSL